jgi:hypothetical protein
VTAAFQEAYREAVSLILGAVADQGMVCTEWGSEALSGCG